MNSQQPKAKGHAFSVILIMTVLMFIGALCIPRLNVQYRPVEENLNLSVSFSCPGSARVVEQEVTSVIEGALNTVAGVSNITANSYHLNISLTSHLSPLTSKEVELIQKMSEFGAAVEQAGKDYSPSGIANYCYELTKVFNQFYHDYSILNEPDEQKKAVRLMLAKNVAKIVKNGMGLLGIEMPERM